MSAAFARKPIRSEASAPRARKALRMHRFLIRFALSGSSVFAWIFVFEYFYLIEPDLAHAFARVSLLYALSQITICLITPYAARVLRNGVVRSLMWATLAGAAAFAVLGATFAGSWLAVPPAWGIVGFALLLAAYRALYWVPYEVE